MCLSSSRIQLSHYRSPHGHPYSHTLFLFMCTEPSALIVSTSLSSAPSNSTPARWKPEFLDVSVSPQKTYWQVMCLSIHSFSPHQSATMFVSIEHVCPNQHRVLSLFSAFPASAFPTSFLFGPSCECSHICTSLAQPVTVP